MQTQLYLVIAGLFFTAAQVNASATANEFVRCDQLAAASVQQCEKAQQTGCNEVAARLRQQCQTEVKQSHNPNEPKHKARRAAEIKLQQQRQLESTTTPVQPQQSSGIESGH